MINFKRVRNDYEVTSTEDENTLLGTLSWLIDGWVYFTGKEGEGGQLFEGVETLKEAQQRVRDYHKKTK